MTPCPTLSAHWPMMNLALNKEVLTSRENAAFYFKWDYSALLLCAGAKILATVHWLERRDIFSFSLSYLPCPSKHFSNNRMYFMYIKMFIVSHLDPVLKINLCSRPGGLMWSSYLFTAYISFFLLKNRNIWLSYRDLHIMYHIVVLFKNKCTALFVSLLFKYFKQLKYICIVELNIFILVHSPPVPTTHTPCS